MELIQDRVNENGNKILVLAFDDNEWKELEDYKELILNEFGPAFFYIERGEDGNRLRVEPWGNDGE